ncbi:MAG: hypothetical protein AAGD28_04745 [Bacteroidota bacterium]
MNLSYKNLFSLLLSFALFLLYSCEKTSINQRAGTFIGEARVSCSEVVDSAGNRVETSIFDATYIDTFTVEVLDAETRKYRIARSSLDTGPCEKSRYDIGFGGVSEYEFDEDFSWVYGFEYDKEWRSHLDLSDPKKLLGYMLQRDIFGKEYYDNQGFLTHKSFYTFEYSIEAEKQ